MFVRKFSGHTTPLEKYFGGTGIAVRQAITYKSEIRVPRHYS
jgi:hypothetical protein